MRKIYIMLIMISILISPVIGDNNSTKKPITYKVFIDNQQGFYKVYDTVSNNIIPYQNRTLNIYRGDTVIWANDIERRLTVISEQNLWDNKSGILADEYKEFIYTFTNPGIYSVHIEEYPTLEQKIIVGPIESNSTSKNVTKINNTKLNSTSKNVTKINNTKLNSTSKNVTKINNTKLNSTSKNVTKINNTKLNSTSKNVTKINNTKLNSTSKNVTKINNTKLNSTNTTIKQNSVLNSLLDNIKFRLSDNIKFRTDIMLAIVLLSMYMLRGRKN